jgi:hypothetical protein
MASQPINIQRRSLQDLVKDLRETFYVGNPEPGEKWQSAKDAILQKATAGTLTDGDRATIEGLIKQANG